LNNRNDKEEARKDEFATLGASRWLEMDLGCRLLPQPVFRRQTFLHFCLFAIVDFAIFPFSIFGEKIFSSHSIAPRDIPHTACAYRP
jgi:hypothetical protein